MKKTCTIAAIAITFLAANVATAQTVKDLPTGVVKVAGAVPGLGEHWADPKDLPLGPIYGVMNGNIVSLVFEVLSKDLQGPRGWEMKFKWPDFLPKPDHIDIEYMPKGHRNMAVPHFAFHGFLVAHAVHAAYKPAGVAGPPHTHPSNFGRPGGPPKGR